MSWAIGEDKHGRDIGYGVPALCDHPNCNKEINRGLSYVCGMINTAGEDRGCGLHFCTDHLGYSPKFGQLCERCYPRLKPPFTRKPDVAEWIHHKLTDPSWAKWRKQNRNEVAAMRASLKAVSVAESNDGMNSALFTPSLTHPPFNKGNE